MTTDAPHGDIIIEREYHRRFVYASLEQFPRPWLDALATEVNGWLQAVRDRNSMGLFWASDMDSLAADRAFEISRRRDGGRFISPSAFRHTLANMDAAGMALTLHITGPVMTFSVRNNGNEAERSARRWLAARRISAAITVAEAAVGTEVESAGAERDRSSPEVSTSITRYVQARYLRLASG